MYEEKEIQKRSWAVLLIVWGGYILLNLSNFSYGVMLPSIRQDLSFTMAQAGILGASAWIVRAGLAIPVSLLVSKINPKRLLQFIFLSVNIGIILQATAQNFLMMFLGRAMVYGVAAVVLAPLAVIKINLFPKRLMGTLNGFESFCSTSGQTLSTLIIPTLLTAMGGWRKTFLVLAAICAVINLLWFIVSKESDGQTKNAKEKLSFFAPLKELTKHKAFWLLILGAPATNIVWSAIYTFWPTYITQEVGFSMQQAGAILGLLPMGSMLAALVSPKITEKIGYDKLMLWPWGFILVFTYGSLMYIRNINILYFAAFITGFGAFVFVPVAMTTFYKLKGISPEAVSVGIATLFGANGLGGAAGSLFVGFAVKHIGLELAIKLSCLTPIIFGILMLFMPELGRRSQEKNLN